MAEHSHGKMDITTQEKTFAGFMQACVIVAVITALILIFLAIVGT